MPDLITLILAFGAAARITRLVVADTITEPVRAWLLPRIARNRHQRALLHRGEPLPAPSKVRNSIVTLLTCHWCAGMWISAAVVAIAALANGHPAYTWPATALTVAYLVGLAADQER